MSKHSVDVSVKPIPEDDNRSCVLKIRLTDTEVDESIDFGDFDLELPYTVSYCSGDMWTPPDSETNYKWGDIEFQKVIGAKNTNNLGKIWAFYHYEDIVSVDWNDGDRFESKIEYLIARAIFNYYEGSIEWPTDSEGWPDSPKGTETIYEVVDFIISKTKEPNFDIFELGKKLELAKLTYVDFALLKELEKLIGQIKK